jgi:hypothetical protein
MGSSTARVKGDPYNYATIFSPPPAPKRQKLQKPSSPRNPEPPSLPKVDKPIHFAKAEAELATYSSMVTKDSEDSLNLGAADQSRLLVVDNDCATQQVKKS